MPSSIIFLTYSFWRRSCLIFTHRHVCTHVCVCVLWYVAQSKDVSSCSCQITKSFRLVYVCKLVAFSLCITSQRDFAARYQVFLSYLFQAHTHTDRLLKVLVRVMNWIFQFGLIYVGVIKFDTKARRRGTEKPSRELRLEFVVSA